MSVEYVTTIHPGGQVERVLKETGPPEPDPPIRVITTQAFYRRLTVNERNALRTGTTDVIADMREDLLRSTFVNLDGAIEAQLLSVGTQQPRVDALLVNGTEAETQTG